MNQSGKGVAKVIKSSAWDLMDVAVNVAKIRSGVKSSHIRIKINNVQVNRICWIKTIIGGWTTSTRMHEQVSLNCIFGCCECIDCMNHYLICPVLWSIVTDLIGGEDSIQVSERVCIQNPSTVKFQRLALAHGIYHACKNDFHCIGNSVLAAPRTVQRRGKEFAREILYRLGAVMS